MTSDLVRPEDVGALPERGIGVDVDTTVDTAPVVELFGLLWDPVDCPIGAELAAVHAAKHTLDEAAE